MSEEISLSVLNMKTGSSTSIKLFTDDTIDTVQTRIGESVGIHPDRLRIYVNGQFDGNYYSKDSRKWENLFLRMSPDGKVVQKSLEFYQASREPKLELAGSYDKSGWMALNPASETTFQELRILGVPEERSWVFPLENVPPEHLPPASQVAGESKTLFKTLHPYTITQFQVIPHSELLPNIEVVYFPRLRTGSPAAVPTDVSRALARQTELITAVSGLNAPTPEHVTISQARWKLALVDTDFGKAVRNRFEQIFYGTTLSPKIPVVSFFSSRNEQSRHKFFTDNPSKSPFLDVRMWSYWWNSTKPSKNKPALVFYRGAPGVPSSRSSFDRITVNSTEITVSCSRTPDSKLTQEQLQKEVKEFLLSIDGLAAFIDPADYDDDRWVLQDMSAVLQYSGDLKEADFRRFDCLRGIYDVADQDKLVFKFLRTDQSDTGLSENQMRILGMLKENEYTSPEDVHEQFPDLSIEECTFLVEGVKQLVSDNPDLGDRQYSLLPTFKFSAKECAVTHAPDMKRVIKYISILRDVLIHPDNSELDEVCPKRMESVATEVAVVPIEESGAAGDTDFLDELLGELSGIGTAEKKEEAVPELKQAKKVRSKGNTSLATYFLTQLRDFDPVLYDPSDPAVSKKCEKTRQPIAIKSEELAKFEGDLAQYDPREEATKILDVKDPDGIVICPEYWCTVDRIPLKKEQLVDETCPLCHGKVRSNDKNIEKTQDTTEYPVIQRDSTSAFPGYVKYKSGSTNKQIPCCFTSSQTYKRKLENVRPNPTELFYVLGDSKTRLGELRLAYVPADIGKITGLKLDYSATVDAANRIQSGNSGFFRAGVGHARDSLPKILGVTLHVGRPSESPEITKRCSFFRTWKHADEDGDDKIAARVSSINKAYEENQLSILEELEYSALSLNCMIYVLYTGSGSDGVLTGCFMNIGAVRNVKRAIIVLVNSADSESVDYVAHVSRTAATPIYNANLYKPQFPKGLISEMEALRVKACVREIPTIDKALAFMNKLPELKTMMSQIKLVLDPYMRAQALYIPGKIILPFRPTSQIPTHMTEHVPGYANISPEDYPQKTEMLNILNHAKELHRGYAYAHDNTNSKNSVVELITASGLRIPVRSGDTEIHPPTEITETVHDVGEDKVAFGKHDKANDTLAKTITYEAEIFEFLLYQLSNDIHSGDHYYSKLLDALKTPDAKTLRPLLREWMDDTITFSGAEEPPAFYSKMRHSCSGSSKDTCTGLCGWDGDSCKVKVRTVSKSLQREALENRLLSTLASNDKIRGIVFNHRVSPFFSSVLYLEMPSEVILSDKDVSSQLKK
jgi:hypothetical protein